MEKKESLREFISKDMEKRMNRLGFIKQTPQKVQKENTGVSGTITFIKHNPYSQKKKEEK